MTIEQTMLEDAVAKVKEEPAALARALAAEIRRVQVVLNYDLSHASAAADALANHLDPPKSSTPESALPPQPAPTASASTTSAASVTSEDNVAPVEQPSGSASAEETQSGLGHSSS